ncbi:MAG: hypothetical protein WBG57_10355 [Ornithinimicrobium sp.]
MALTLSVLAAFLMHWTVSGVHTAGFTPIPVAQGVRYCAAGVAGLLALILSWFCVLGGSYLLLEDPSKPRHTNCRTRRIALRVAATLVACTLSTPVAMADDTRPLLVVATDAMDNPDESAPATTESVQDCAAGTTRAGGQPIDSTASALPVSSIAANPRKAVVPDWRPTRSELPVPATWGTAEDESARDHESAHVVVLRGDSLWDLAATELGPRASTDEIAARWPAWYQANRVTIGPDPDTILPGQILTIPGRAGDNSTIGERP